MSGESRARAVAEFVGALGIVLSLVFVGMELRHANNLSEAEAVNSINQMINELTLSTMQDEGLSELIGRLNRDLLPEREDLSPGQQLRVLSYYAAYMNIFEAAWKYMDRGIIGPEESAAYMSTACTTFSDKPRAVTLWNSLKGAFAPGYVSHVESRCAPLGGTLAGT